MVLMPVAQARDDLAELCSRVAQGNERVILTRYGTPVAAIVPIREEALFEKFLKWLDMEETRAIAAQTSDDDLVSAEDLLATLRERRRNKDHR